MRGDRLISRPSDVWMVAPCTDLLHRQPGIAAQPSSRQARTVVMPTAGAVGAMAKLKRLASIASATTLSYSAN